MTDVVVRYHDEAHIKVCAEPGVMMEMSEAMTFLVPGYQHTPKYKSGFWDGKIRLLHPITGYIYAGLRARVRDFCVKRGYSYSEEPEFDSWHRNISESLFTKWVRDLDLPKHIVPTDYQMDSFMRMVRERRLLLLSPTNSGKSLIIYLLARWFDQKVLVIVPRKQLVSQLVDNFREYGMPEDWATTDKDDCANHKIIITTWQNIFKLPKEWFDKFGLVVGDEAHNYKAKSLVSIMTKLDKCRYRFGCTGSLDETQVHQMVLEGLFGPLYTNVTQSELIDRGISAILNVHCVVLQHPKDVVKKLGKVTYEDEVKFIEDCAPRNQFIKNLALSLGNVQLNFGDKIIRIPRNTMIPLTNGTEKKAISITIDDDVLNDWIELF